MFGAKLTAQHSLADSKVLHVIQLPAQAFQ